MSPAGTGRTPRGPRAPSLRVERALQRQGHRVLAGMDEVGRGALAGPVTVGVVVIDEAVRTAPQGVRDSKLLQPHARERMVPRIERWARAHAVAHASADEIDAVGIIAALRLAGLRALAACGVRPDLMCLGKGLTAGYLAMSATVASGRVFDAFLGDDLGPRTLYHGHSFSGNALAAAVALRHLELLDAWAVLANVRARSDELRALLTDRIAPLPQVGEVRLHGLMGGVELAPPTDGLRWGRRVCAAAVRHGVLLRPLGDVVVLMPPLTVTSEEIHEIVRVLTTAIAEGTA